MHFQTIWQIEKENTKSLCDETEVWFKVQKLLEVTSQLSQFSPVLGTVFFKSLQTLDFKNGPKGKDY